MKQLIPLPPARNDLERLNTQPLGIERPAYGSEPAAAATGGLLDYWRIIRRHKGALILISFLGALAGVVVTVPQTPVYQARTSIEIQDMNDSFMNLNKVNPVSEGSSVTSLNDIQTQIKILQSETLFERVHDKLRSQKRTGLPTADRLTAWRKALGLEPPASEAENEKELARIARSVRVRSAGQTRIIEILCDSTDRNLAAEFANTLINEFIEQNMEARWKMTERTGVWLTRQLDDMRVKLERSEDGLQAYARQSGLMFTADKNTVAEEKLRQLQEELSKAQGDRVTKQSRYEMASRATAETLADVLNEPSLREYQAKLTDLKRQRSDLIVIYTPTHSKIKRLDAEIQTIESALQSERTAILRRIRNDFDQAERREKLLTTDYATQSRLVSDQSEKAIQYNILKREVDSNRQLYDAMLQKMKESSVAAAMRASNVRVVDAAKPPKRPYKPDVPVNAGLGLLSGLFLGISFIVMRERTNRTLQEPGDAAFYLNLVELGVIPAGLQEQSKRFAYLNRRAIEASPVTADGSPERLEMVTWQQKPSIMAESFRAVLTSILFSGKESDRRQVLMLTSAGPKEGKTTVVCNLGIALSEVKGPVLLIDADMRRPRLHDVFDVPNDTGLSTILRQRTVSEEDLAAIVHPTSIPGLFVLASGPATSNAANLLHSRMMETLLELLREKFEMILIDTPPMLQIPDARVVGRLVDGVIMVVRAGRTTRDAALAARQRFAGDDTPVTGVILNDWDPRTSPNGYYGNYNGYYYKTHYYYSSKDGKD